MLLHRFLELCSETGEYPASVAQAIGYDKSIVTKWRKQSLTNGGVVEMSSQKLKLLAEHFNVSSDYLLGITDERNPLDITSVINSPYKMLLLDESNGLTEKSMEQVIRVMRTIKGLQED